MERTSLSWALLAATLSVVRLQTASRENPTIGSCQAPPTLEMLGSTVSPSKGGLVSAALKGNDRDGSPVQILSANLVCQAPGITRGTVGSVSFIVAYKVCQTSLLCVNRTEQFQFDCGARIVGPPRFFPPRKAGGLVRTPDLRGATLNTTLNDRCGECSQIPVNNIAADIITHCVGT
jgi:hypothetical protein